MNRGGMDLSEIQKNLSPMKTVAVPETELNRLKAIEAVANKFFDIRFKHPGNALPSMRVWLELTDQLETLRVKSR